MNEVKLLTHQENLLISRHLLINRHVECLANWHLYCGHVPGETVSARVDRPRYMDDSGTF